MYYCGKLKNVKRVEVFYSKSKPTNSTHGHLYDYTFGGYKSKDKAIQVAHYQFPYNKVELIDMRKRECKVSRALYQIANI